LWPIVVRPRCSRRTAQSTAAQLTRLDSRNLLAIDRETEDDDGTMMDGKMF